MNNRQLFFHHLAQTSPAPIALEIKKASGIHLYDETGKSYIDLISGISVANTGHLHPAVTEAIKKQLDDYMHVLVYGELVQSPQVQYAKRLTDALPAHLNSVYFTNSGAEAVEGAMKLAKRVTNRAGIIAFNHSYHGSTQGALSIMGDEYWRNAYRPLLPAITHADFNSFASLDFIDDTTACVVVETVQAEAGVRLPDKSWLKALRQKCTEQQALLIMDEIQVGFGRTGTLWGFEQYDVVPDVLLLGKALGGGMPMGAFIAERTVMAALTLAPLLGHITTFGGHPVCCAAGLASLELLLKEQWIKEVAGKEKLFKELLVHEKIKSVKSAGLLIAVEFESFEVNKKVIDRCLETGLLTDWFLFAPGCMRIAPPLIITDDDIHEACRIIIEAINHAG
jgi:acetylornithine/N-succinyldiaminopimelate aminotransferase